jgi:hypothetical protein
MQILKIFEKKLQDITHQKQQKYILMFQLSY